MKKVSVIIPTYNRGEFLQRAVESIVRQNYSNIEIIIVDDGSTDNTEAIVENLINMYPFIMYCRNTRTKGPSGARNTGIMKASGDYLAFLDSDDVWLEGHLIDGLRILENKSDIDVSFGNYKAVDHYTGKPLYNFFDQKKILHSLQSTQIASGTRLLNDNLFEALIKEGFFHLGTSIIRKSLLNEILLNESLTYAEDRDFAIRLYKKANASFAYQEKPVYIAYKHDSNLTNLSGNIIGEINRAQKAIEDRIYLLKEYLMNYQLSSSEKRTLVKLISESLLNLAYLYRKKKDYLHALASIVQSTRFKFSLRQLTELVKVLMEQIISFCK